LADLLFITLCVPATAADYAFTSVWQFGEFWCKLVQYLIVVTALVSIYTLVLMSVARFLAIVYPIKSKSLRKESSAVKAVIVLWALVLLVCIPAFMAHGLYVEHTSGDQFDKLIIIIIAQPYLLKAGNRVITFFEIFRQSLRRERKQCRKIDFILIMASYCLNFIKLFNCNVYFLQKCLFFFQT